MNCETAQQWIALYVYDELSDEHIHQLELHLSGCEPCRMELQAAVALRHAMELTPVKDPSANLVAESRIRLSDALDKLPPAGILDRLRSNFFGSFAQLRSMPVTAASLVLCGALGGGLVPHRHQAAPTAAVATVPADPSFSDVYNISDIVPDPASNSVEVRYNRVVPEVFQGSLEDPNLRQLLAVGIHNTHDEAVQRNIVGMLAGECRAGHSCGDDGPTRDALLDRLRSDHSAAVRSAALNGLEPFVAQDIRVRDAVLDALMHDPSADVRTEAIRILQPAEADSSVRVALHTLAQGDKNPGIRLASQHALSSVPDVQ